jgi:hypothetical protein
MGSRVWWRPSHSIAWGLPSKNQVSWENWEVYTLYVDLAWRRGVSIPSDDIFCLLYGWPVCFDKWKDGTVLIRAIDEDLRLR